MYCYCEVFFWVVDFVKEVGFGDEEMNVEGNVVVVFFEIGYYVVDFGKGVVKVFVVD